MAQTVDPEAQNQKEKALLIIGALRGVGGRGVGGLNTYNKDLIRPI